MNSETDTDPCIVCNAEQAVTVSTANDSVRQICPRCGEFVCTGTALSIVARTMTPETRAKLSGWVFENNRDGSIPNITSEKLKQIMSQPDPSFMDRAIRLLAEARRSVKNPGEHFSVAHPKFLAATYSTSDQEIAGLLKILQDRNWAQAVAFGGICEILPEGYIKIDEMNSSPQSSAQCFVAMWFHQDLNDAYSEGFQRGIAAAGYTPIRIDETEHVNRIDEEILKQIESSKFLVCDFTGHRGGVYFEAGYARGKEIPVIWTCQKQDMGELHFDIRQFNCIDWESPHDLADRLTRRITSLMGPGPNVF